MECVMVASTGPLVQRLHREFTQTSEFYSPTEIWPVIGSTKREVSTKWLRITFEYLTRVISYRHRGILSSGYVGAVLLWTWPVSSKKRRHT